ncbi:hypothetical protein M0R45_028250 [Rubus argutus]|uniref:Peptidase A1 domain-containing protein n=1 Tax=Rubus argutus TaxID=59490 RepID=A0AAW1W870_RUBAR
MSFTSLPTNTFASFSSSKISSNISSAPSLPLSLMYNSLLVVEVLIGLPAIKATLFVDVASPFTFVPGNYRRYNSLSSSKMNATDALCVKPLITDLDQFCRYSDGDGARAAVYLFDFFLNLDVHKPLPFAWGNFPGGTDPEDFLDGILGLGSGHPVSLVEQLHNTTLGRFSYCIPATLMPSENSSSNRAAPTLDFGVEATIRGQGWINTTLVRGTIGAYYLNVTSILVQDRPLVVKPELFWPNRGSGGFILQSRFPYTQLLPQVYDSLKQAVIAYFWQLYKVDPLTQPVSEHLDLCHDLRHFRQGGGPEFHAPSIQPELEFGAALLELPITFMEDFPEVNETCLMVIPLDPGKDRSFLGTVQQVGHRFLVDIHTSTLSFSPNQC